jgi:uncharacterized lipoprotein YajG
MRVLLVAAMLLLAGCATNYEPKTVEGAQCKQRCASDMGQCVAAHLICTRAASTCYDSCREMEALKQR